MVQELKEYFTNITSITKRLHINITSITRILHKYYKNYRKILQISQLLYKNDT